MPSTSTSDLTADDRRILAYLIKDWKKPYRVTTVEQGIKALGYPTSHALRMRIGAGLKLAYAKEAELSERLKEWGPETFILTNDEKLVARCIVLCSRQTGAVPSRTDIALAAGLQAEQVNLALDSLSQLGFVEGQAGGGDAGYGLSETYARFLHGLGFTFHTLIPEHGIEFNVQCAADALLLAASEYAGQTVQLRDSCFHCLDRMEMIVRQGKLSTQSPPTIRLYEGDG